MADPRYVQIAAAASGPVDVFAAGAHLRLDDIDPSVETIYLPAAVEWVEKYTGRSLVTQTWEAVLDAFPADGVIPLANGPLASVTSVTYLDTAGLTQTLATSLYQVDVAGSRVVRAPDAAWPATSAKVAAVRVRYVTGTTPAAVPTPIRAAILLLLGHLYERREDTLVGTSITQIPMGVQALLGPYRLILGAY